MKMRLSTLAFCFLCILPFCSCSSSASGTDAFIEDKCYPFDEAKVRLVMDSVLKVDGGKMYADAFAQKVYAKDETDTLQQAKPLLWVNKYGIDAKADTLLSWLRDVESQGVKRSAFCADEIENDLQQFRSLNMDSCAESEVCVLLGRLEQRLTRAYFRYAFGQRFGYAAPNNVFNNVIGAKSGDSYRHLFDFQCELPTDSFAIVAINHLSTVDSLSTFLHEVQPTDSLFYQMCREYQRALKAGDKTRTELARLNLERSRWRYPRPALSGKYVFVNLPSYELTAVNADKKSSLKMKVCCGKTNHQTPLLYSNINKLELNPYWTVPYNILKKEIAPSHAGDAGYFSRNRMVAIDNRTREIVSAASLSRSQLTSGRYTIRQDKGAGNSLGRMIFRFPNRFAVFLHDTNSPGAFNRESRAVSHGCVRVQKPLDLALFLIDNPSDLLIDKIRVAIDKQPLTEKGRKYKANTAKDKYMGSYGYDPAIPVFIDYYTLYPEQDGTMKSYPDIYGYDKSLKKVLDQF